MPYNPILAAAGALLSFGIAFFAFFLSSRSFAYRTLGAGMLLFAIEQLILSISYQTGLPSQVILWHQMRLIAGSLVPGVWLLFSLSFGRANYWEFIQKWKWAVFASFALPLILAAGFRNSLFDSITVINERPEWLLDLGTSGYLYQIVVLVGAALVLMNLERTFKAFSGSIRWQIKFIVIGLFGLFASRIYVGSQALLYSSINTSLESINSGALILADMLIIVSLIRSRLADVDIYLSQTIIHNSLAILVIGVYLLGVGIVAGMLNSFNTHGIPLDFFFVFLALMGLAAFFVSGKLRQDFKSLVIRHFMRPQYDYQKEWSEFTRRTAPLVDTRELCATVAGMLSDTFGTPSVNIWLVDEIQQDISLGGFTVLSAAEAKSSKPARDGTRNLIRIIGNCSGPFDLQEPGKRSTFETLRSTLPFRDARLRYCAPLITGKETVGFVALSGRINGVPLSSEDFSLLRTIADQVAGSLLNLRLSERLRTAKQMEAFQTVSTFLAHDLKNIASTLSVTLQNLPRHFDNPEFRSDALQVISGSVDKINTISRRFSVLRESVELNRMEVDLNVLVADTVASLNSCFKVPLKQDLHPMPKLLLDAEQMRKVLTNLILNANDAVSQKGLIRVETRNDDNRAVLSVIDDGAGISKEFLQNSLFQPFKTTKKDGLGIGLFQSKMIVEAHHGAIEVESEEGAGTTFRIKLPLGSSTDAG